MGCKGIAIRAEVAGEFQYVGIAQCLLHGLAHGMGVVLGLHHGDGNARLPVQHIVGGFNCRRDEQIANIYFIEFFLVDVVQKYAFRRLS